MLWTMYLYCTKSHNDITSSGSVEAAQNTPSQQAKRLGMGKSLLLELRSEITAMTCHFHHLLTESVTYPIYKQATVHKVPLSKVTELGKRYYLNRGGHIIS